MGAIISQSMPMSQPAPVNRPCQLTVKHVQDEPVPVPNLPDRPWELGGLPFSCGGAHIKIIMLSLTRPERDSAAHPHREKGPRQDPSQKPVIRTFTIRAFRRGGAGARHRFAPARRGRPLPAASALHAKPGTGFAISARRS